jgi:transcriptional regulator GlxA family with amidase domain
MFNGDDAALQKSSEYALLSLMYKLYHQCGVFCLDGTKNNHAPPVQHHISHAHVTKALFLMQANVRNSLAIDELARLLALSTEHFIRIFRAEIKLTPHQYMLRLKMEGATGLLISTTMSVGQIADWFGFENQFHFSRCFKQCTGVSPLAYRKNFIQPVDFAIPKSCEAATDTNEEY